jgi:hypothetical protein
MAKVVEAIQLKNTDAGSQPVTRTVIITYIDTTAIALKLMALLLALPNTT